MLKRVKERKNATEVSPWMPSATPVSSVSPAPETALLTSCVVPEVPLASASLAQPSIVLSALSAAASICADCSTIPPTTSRKIPTAIAEEGEQHQAGARGARHAAARQPRDARGADGGHDRARHHRLDDGGGEAEDPDDPDQDGGDADQQPRDAAEAAQPARRHEHPREVAGRDLRDRGARLALRHGRPPAAEEPHGRPSRGGAPSSSSRRWSASISSRIFVSVSIPCRRRTVCIRPLAAAPETTVIRAMPVNMTRAATTRPADVRRDDVAVADGRHGLGRPPERPAVVGEVVLVDQPHEEGADQHDRDRVDGDDLDGDRRRDPAGALDPAGRPQLRGRCDTPP